MIKVNKQAKCVLAKLTHGLEKPGDHQEFDNSTGAFMSVHVENIGDCDMGKLFSIAHYYEQNGDLMRDPEMVFIKGQDSEYYPVDFQQDNMGMYQRAVEIDCGKVKAFRPALQKELAVFTGKWMRNIKMQQEL